MYPDDAILSLLRFNKLRHLGRFLKVYFVTVTCSYHPETFLGKDIIISKHFPSRKFIKPWLAPYGRIQTFLVVLVIVIKYIQLYFEFTGSPHMWEKSVG